MRAVLFDIDGTLIDAGGAGQAAMEQAVAQLFGHTRPVQGIPAAGRTDRAIGRDLFDYYAIPETPENWGQYLSTYLSLLPDSLKTRPGAVLPGVLDLMDHFARQSDVVLGLLTGNFAEGARLKLRHYGLDHHFRTGGFGDHHLSRDDVARDALTALRQMIPEVDPTEVWVIGDTPADVQCARAIGARVVAVATGIFSHEDLALHGPDVLLPDLTQAHEWLQGTRP